MPGRVITVIVDPARTSDAELERAADTFVRATGNRVCLLPADDGVAPPASPNDVAVYRPHLFELLPALEEHGSSVLEPGLLCHPRPSLRPLLTANATDPSAVQDREQLLQVLALHFDVVVRRVTADTEHAPTTGPCVGRAGDLLVDLLVGLTAAPSAPIEEALPAALM